MEDPIFNTTVKEEDAALVYSVDEEDNALVPSNTGGPPWKPTGAARGGVERSRGEREVGEREEARDGKRRRRRERYGEI